MAAPLAVRSVTFDLDGTLVDTLPDLSVAANAMLRELGLPEKREDQVRDYVGRGMDHLVARCLDGRDELLAQAAGIFRRHYAAVNGRAARLYPGVIAGLERLGAKRLKLAVVTNKPAAFTDPLLAATGLARYFAFALSGDSLPQKKPHPLPLLAACARLGVAPRENLHIGDSRNDAASARAAGCPVFCVPYGYNEGRDVREIDCDAIVATLEDAAGRIVNMVNVARSDAGGSTPETGT